MSTPDLLVFGGTFDPPHQAHVDLAREALARFPQSRLLVLPAPEPAGAGGVHKAPAAAFESRLAMTRAAFATLGPRASVEPLETELPPPHYTVATLAELARRWPGAHFGFLMGQDSLETFPRWREPQRVLERTSLVVAPRLVAPLAGGAPPPDAPPPGVALRRTAEAVLATLGLAAHWNEPAAAFALPAKGHGVYLLPRPVGDAASHLTRAALARGDALPDGWLPADVERHIRHHHLYGT